MFNILENFGLTKEAMLKRAMPMLAEQAPEIAANLLAGINLWLASIQLTTEERNASIMVYEQDGQTYLSRVVWHNTGAHLTRVVDTYHLNLLRHPNLVDAIKKVDATNIENVLNLLKVE